MVATIWDLIGRNAFFPPRRCCCPPLATETFCGLLLTVSHLLARNIIKQKELLLCWATTSSRQEKGPSFYVVTVNGKVCHIVDQSHPWRIVNSQTVKNFLFLFFPNVKAKLSNIDANPKMDPLKLSDPFFFFFFFYFTIVVKYSKQSSPFVVCVNKFLFLELKKRKRNCIYFTFALLSSSS